ncbi:MAG: exonuclease [Chloroflexota bacterium]|nr:exonuclease [Chloroflexota bacterium]MDE2899099.1 exonuclease [Chloroflexota bacterium]
MPVRFTAFGGAGEIGGNKLLLEDDDWQILFDFGMSFGALGTYFEEFLQPRTVHGLSDYLLTGLLPPLEGLYRDDLNALPEHAAIWRRLRGSPGYRNDVSPRAVVLSHAHADHVGYVSLLRPDIPVVTGGLTAAIAKAMQDGGQSADDTQTVFLRPRTPRDGLLITEARTPYQQRPWALVADARWPSDAAAYWARRYAKSGPDPQAVPATTGLSEVDGREIRAFPVDHSIPGAHGFAIETSAGWIGYTGDIRMHGRRAEQTWNFAQELAKLDLVALICEGTQAARTRGASESDVRVRANECVSQTDGLVVADFGPRNIERMETFLHAAHQTNRQLVVLMKDALLLKAMHTVDPATPLPSAPDGLLVFDDRRATTTAWQDELSDEFAGALVPPTDIATHPGAYVLCMSFFDVTRLLDLGELTAGAWIYSSSEPYDEESQLDMQRLRNWASLLNLDFLGGASESEAEAAGFHASGHASGPDLQRFIETVNPRTLIPIHLQADGLDFYRHAFAGTPIRVCEPRWGRPLTIE